VEGGNPRLLPLFRRLHDYQQGRGTMITVSAFTFMLVCGIIIAFGAKAGHWDNRRTAAQKARVDAFHKRYENQSDQQPS
jgi:hypothetical protein